MALIQDKPNDVATVLMAQLISAVVEILAGLGLIVGFGFWLTSLASGFVDTYLLGATGLMLGLGFVIVGFIRLWVVYYASEQGEWSRELLILLAILGILSLNPVSFAVGVLTIVGIMFGPSARYWE